MIPRKAIGLLLVLLCVLTACSIRNESDAEPIATKASDAVAFVQPAKKVPVSEKELSYYSPGMRQIYDRGKLRVAIYAKDKEPFFYVNPEGKLAGMDVELATDIAAKFGVELEIVRTAQSFDEVAKQVAAGEADIAVSKLSATLSRAKTVLFSDSYLTLRQGLLLNRLKLAQLGASGKDLLQKIQAPGLKIGVIAGTSYVSFAKEQFPQAEIVLFATEQEAMEAALKGDIAAFFYDELELKELVTSNPQSSIELQVTLLTNQVDPITIAVNPEDVQMLTWINLYLHTNRAKIDGLLTKYNIQVGK